MAHGGFLDANIPTQNRSLQHSSLSSLKWLPTWRLPHRLYTNQVIFLPFAGTTRSIPGTGKQRCFWKKKAKRRARSLFMIRTQAKRSFMRRGTVRGLRSSKSPLTTAGLLSGIRKSIGIWCAVCRTVKQSPSMARIWVTTCPITQATATASTSWALLAVLLMHDYETGTRERPKIIWNVMKSIKIEDNTSRQSALRFYN